MIKLCFAYALLLSARLASAQQLAVTFDDLPSHGEMPHGQSRLQIAESILTTLNAEHLPPTYGFINGVRIEEDPTSLIVLETWRAAGQPLGNHTWAHGDYDAESPQQFVAEVTRNEPLLERLMGHEDWHWLRYPFLREGDTVLKRRAARTLLAGRGYKIAEVSMDFEDYLWNAPYARCVDSRDDRSIRRLHDSYLSVAEQFYALSRQLSRRLYGRDLKYVLLLHIGAFDAKMLPELLALYRRKGVRFISLSDAMSDEAYRDDPDIGEPAGGTQLELVMRQRQLPFPPNDKPYRELEGLCR